MKRIAALSSALVLAGCVSTPEYTQGDFTYEDISSYGGVGVRATSILAGKTIDIFASCIEGERQYFIDPTSIFGVEEKRWTPNIDGSRFWRSEVKYSDEASFIASLATLEVVSPPRVFGEGRRFKVSNSQIERIPTLCKKKQAEHFAYVRNVKDKEIQENESLISGVVNRTGTKPMLPGKNQMDFNNLVLLFQQTGASKHQGKFVWVADGDYRVAQVAGGRVLLMSMTNPADFPAITIITDKEVLEGQFWSSVSHGPLEFIGVSTYQTVLGASRQTILFKPI